MTATVERLLEASLVVRLMARLKTRSWLQGVCPRHGRDLCVCRGDAPHEDSLMSLEDAFGRASGIDCPLLPRVKSFAGLTLPDDLELGKVVGRGEGTRHYSSIHVDVCALRIATVGRSAST